MRIYSWNVNGIRSCEKKGFSTWLSRCRGDIVGLQEVRAKAEQVPENLREHKRWHLHVHSAQRPGYSGVAIFSKTQPDSVETGLGEERFDCEGRYQLARFGKLSLANIYFPNGSGKDRDHSRVPYKLDFYRAVFEAMAKETSQGQRVLVMGDFNTAHAEIDLARPKSNHKTSGFLPIERQELDGWLQGAFVDTFRHFEKSGGHYSWWSQRQGVRERNVGWRIDYVLANPAAMAFVQQAFIKPQVMGSDHCPVGVLVDEGILL